MRILQLHNYYQLPGGEDQVVQTEACLLRSRGHEVDQFTTHNQMVDAKAKLTLAGLTIWNPATYECLRKRIKETSPAVVHVHNTFPLISPSAYYAARAEGVSVVQTLHNYRLICPSATLFRNGEPCEKCVGRALATAAVTNSCYRNSQPISAVVAAMLFSHRLAGTWSNLVSRYIALTEFSRNKFIQGGLPGERLVVKPNCLAIDPGVGQGDGLFVLFVGRIAEEKGIRTLLRAAQELAGQIPIKIVGTGPLEASLRGAVPGDNSIEWLGQRSHDDVLDLMKRASMLVFPSEWYECLPMTILEAYAVGLPVIGTRLGSTATIIREGETGLLFRSGDFRDLAAKIASLWHGSAARVSMRRSARLEFESKYSAEANYQQLVGIYADSMRGTGGRTVEHELRLSEAASR